MVSQNVLKMLILRPYFIFTKSIFLESGSQTIIFLVSVQSGLDVP